MATKPTLNDLMYEYYFGLEGTPVTAAGAPTSPVATAGAGFVSVAFVAPAVTGSEPILGYEVTLSNGRVASGTSSPIVVPTPGGSAVTATVKAFNGALGVASAASNSVTPTVVPTVPGAPTVGTLTAGQAQVSLAFTAPANNGGSAITDYRVTLSNGQIGSGAASPIVVAGVPSNPPVSATVAARNLYGYGPESAVSNSASATPEAAGGGGPVPGVTPPGAPTSVVATAGDGQVGVTWLAPASPGGAPITNYRLTWSGGQTNVVGNVLTGFISSVTNGVVGTATVAASNNGGSTYGPDSVASNSVTPTVGILYGSTDTTRLATAARVKLGSGRLVSITNAGSNSATITAYDAHSSSGRVIYTGSITAGSTVTLTDAWAVHGIYVTIAGTSPQIDFLTTEV